MIISFVNQKGGVGKTSTCLHVAGELIKENKKVLLVDMDPQGSLSYFFYGHDLWSLDNKVRQLLIDDRFTANDVIAKTKYDNIDIISNNLAFSMFDVEISEYAHKNSLDVDYLLAEELSEVKDEYDYILIDSPPSLAYGMRLSLVASDAYLCVTLAQEWAAVAAYQMLSYISTVISPKNLNLINLGILINNIDGRKKVEKTQEQFLRSNFSNMVFESVINNYTVFNEAKQKKVMMHEYINEKNEAYLQLQNFINEFIGKLNGKEKI